MPERLKHISLMKNSILFFLFLASSLQAQTVTKSFVLSIDGVNYLEVTRTTAEDGLSYTETANLVGPAASLASDQADKIEGQMRSLAESAYRVSFTNKYLKVAEKSDSLILALTTISPLKVILARYQAALLAPGWTIDQGGGLGFQALAFTINAQNNLRYSIAGAATKAATTFGPIIVLKNYPASPTDAAFYISENGQRYFTLPNRAVVIKKP